MRTVIHCNDNWTFCKPGGDSVPSEMIGSRNAALQKIKKHSIPAA